MNTEVPVNGLQAAGGVHSCPQQGAGARGLVAAQCSQCAYMHRMLGSVRVRCRHDVQGRECPKLLLDCPFEHWASINTTQLPWVYGDEMRAPMACTREVEVGRGRGSWAVRHGRFSGGFVCGSGDDAWLVPGPVNGIEWRRRYAAIRTGEPADLAGFPELGGVTTTPRTIRAGARNGSKSKSQKARRKLRRQREAELRRVRLAAERARA